VIEKERKVKIQIRVLLFMSLNLVSEKKTIVFGERMFFMGRGLRRDLFDIKPLSSSVFSSLNGFIDI
jgi:hypothetical protein